MIRALRTELPVQDCCRLLGVSRASFYRDPAPVRGPDTELEQLCARYPRYGYRRMAAMLARTPKQVRLQMARHGLGVPKKRRRTRTTFPVPVDAPNLCLTPTRPGQLLASDFTYIPIPAGFAYLAITLDVFSRRVRGFALSRSMNRGFTVKALEMALGDEDLQEGWVHHSDRGSQYGSDDFRKVVELHKGTISFSAPASPQENPYAESFFSRFKDEVIRVQETLPYPKLLTLVEEFVDFYNEMRPHSSLGNISPFTFERRHAEQALKESVS